MSFTLSTARKWLVVGLPALLVAAVIFFPGRVNSVLIALTGGDPADAANAKLQWPPRAGEPYPALVLRDASGERVPLESFRGKVLLIEPIGMSCPACVAFAGGNQRGPFADVRPQADLPSVEKLLSRFASGVSLADPDLVYIQLLLFDESLGVPDADDIRRWHGHFNDSAARNPIVLAGTKSLQGKAGYDLVPGFQLVGRDFVLRSDSTGPRPQHGLYDHLLPMLPRLLAER
jgi:hypothetical protein